MTKVIFGSVEVTTDQQKRIEEVRKSFYDVLLTINDNVLDSREKSLAITKIEEACMWAVKAVSTEKKEGVNDEES